MVANADHYHWNYAAEDLRTKKIILYLPFIMANATVPLIMAIDAKIMRTIYCWHLVMANADHYKRSTLIRTTPRKDCVRKITAEKGFPITCLSQPNDELSTSRTAAAVRTSNFELRTSPASFLSTSSSACPAANSRAIVLPPPKEDSMLAS